MSKANTPSLKYSSGTSISENISLLCSSRMGISYSTFYSEYDGKNGCAKIEMRPYGVGLFAS